MRIDGGVAVSGKVFCCRDRTCVLCAFSERSSKSRDVRRNLLQARGEIGGLAVHRVEVAVDVGRQTALEVAALRREQGAEAGLQILCEIVNRDVVSAEQFALGRLVWAAFTSADPTVLNAAANDAAPSALPFLAGAASAAH